MQVRLCLILEAGQARSEKPLQGSIMNKIVASLVLGLALIASTSEPAEAKKDEKQISGLELQQLQTHDFDADKKVTFGSVMSVFQDAGYRIQAADLETGLITGIGSSKGKVTYNLFWGIGKSKKTPIVSAYIEEISSRMTRVRLNFVMGKVKSTLYSSQPQDEEPIIDPVVYQDAFEKVSQAVFLRQSMAETTPPIEKPPTVGPTVQPLPEVPNPSPTPPATARP
jgi:hypothetical protein